MVKKHIILYFNPIIIINISLNTSVIFKNSIYLQSIDELISNQQMMNITSPLQKNSLR